jgi:hypothetical protein
VRSTLGGSTLATKFLQYTAPCGDAYKLAGYCCSGDQRRTGDADETTADLHFGAIVSRHLSRHRRPL